MAASAISYDHRHRLLTRLADARRLSDALFERLRPEALYDRPIPERHRLIFYLGHLEAFDWNLLARSTFDLPAFHARFDHLFAFGIDPVDGNLPTDQPGDWPRAEEIRAYNQRTRDTLDRTLAERDWADPALPFLADGQIVQVALEHRLMHAETLAYLLHQLPPEKKLGRAPAPHRAASPRPERVEVPAGTTRLGLMRAHLEDFGWDNEFQPQPVSVPAFAIDVYPVTNGQFLPFLEAGGYRERSLWPQADWNWKESQGITHPHFWLPANGGWRARTMFGEVPLPLAWPVYVSHAEAAAYARWAGQQLPTEVQWHRAAYGTPAGTEHAYPWGEEAPGVRHGNFDFQRWDPVRVDAHPAGKSAFGVADLVGNGWEWTSTPFAPLPGFQPFPFYPGYSANFFDGQHYVLKGGSARTAACLLRRSFRNWFQPRYPYLYATFRLVEA